MTSALRTSLVVLLVFGLIYNISFLVAPSVSTGRLAVLGLLALSGAGGRAEVWLLLREYWAEISFGILLLLYGLVLYLSSGAIDTTQVSRIVHFSLFSILGAALTVVVCDRNLDRFLQVFVTATVVQSIFIAISFLSPQYRLWLASVAVEGGNIPLTNGLQVPGLSNSSGALLSLQQALGVFAALFGARRAARRLARLGFLVSAVVATISTLVVARTGLQLALIFVVLFALGNGWRSILRVTLVAAAVVLGLVFFGERIENALAVVNPSAPATFDRAFRVFVQGRADDSFRDLVSQRIPELDLETVLGTGLVAAAPGRGNASGNDSGYVQTSYALGLPMAALFYACLFTVVGRLWLTSRSRWVLGGLLLLMFVVELKEPFILKYTYAYLALSLLWLDRPDPGVSLHTTRALAPRPPVPPPELSEFAR